MSTSVISDHTTTDKQTVDLTLPSRDNPPRYHRTHPYACSICDRSFRNVTVLKAHVRVHGADKVLFTSNTCEKQFSQVSQRAGATDRRFVCDICRMEFADLREKEAHVRCHRNGTAAFLSSSSKSRRRVKRKVTSSGNVCNEGIIARGFRDRHTIVHGQWSHLFPGHNVAGQYICKVCQQTSSSFSALRQHRKLHRNPTSRIGTSVATSSVCSASSRQQEVGSARNSGSGKFRRSVCKWRFPGFSGCQQHVEIRAEKEPFRCETCGKRYRYKHVLTKHEHVHRDYRRFAAFADKLCSELEQSPVSNDLADGVSEDVHVCEICHQEFRDRRLFETHLRLHSHLRTCYQPMCTVSRKKRHRLRTL